MALQANWHNYRPMLIIQNGNKKSKKPADISEERTIRDRNLLEARDSDHHIQWKVKFNLGNSSRQISQCRNSIQGKSFLTDELGYVCERKDLLVNGCCNVNAPSSSQYVCKSCLASGCCSVYEFCVSCCLQPDKLIVAHSARFAASPPARPVLPMAGPPRLAPKCVSPPGKFPQPLLERFLNRAAEGFQNLFTAVEDHFELCLAKCRTSSQSVQHENTYRNPQAKYCYGESPPELLPG
ncbi:SREBP regulating gene protein-like [Myxocyprinus asiaticus]|uniref:SREBP regulating gene protein-like n=1 Tax=Myxocyprinus asiaticus TaxID=70543 RepID=UPI0022226C15|nr:SREBP regulating gene protein-like [Myxocyprinus asiaticus]